jgi:hypothetical protein
MPPSKLLKIFQLYNGHLIWLANALEQIVVVSSQDVKTNGLFELRRKTCQTAAQDKVCIARSHYTEQMEMNERRSRRKKLTIFPRRNINFNSRCGNEQNTTFPVHEYANVQKQR